MRTFGTTTDCKGCRFWSEMVAQAGGDIIGVQAMCLNPKSELKSTYTHGSRRCDEWKSGHLGAIDEPPHDGSMQAAYDEEDAIS